MTEQPTKPPTREDFDAANRARYLCLALHCGEPGRGFCDRCEDGKLRTAYADHLEAQLEQAEAENADYRRVMDFGKLLSGRSMLDHCNDLRGQLREAEAENKRLAGLFNRAMTLLDALGNRPVIHATEAWPQVVIDECSALRAEGGGE